MTALTTYADVTDRLSTGLYAVLKTPGTPPSIFIGESDDLWLNLVTAGDAPFTRAELWVSAGETGGTLFIADHAFRVDSAAKLRKHGKSSFLIAGEHAAVYRTYGAHLLSLPEREHVEEAEFWAATDPSTVLVIWDSGEYVPF
jgi:hypothetical protein